MAPFVVRFSPLYGAARKSGRVAYRRPPPLSYVHLANTKAPFSAITMLTSMQPYGPLISLDGIHPSAEGSRVLAEAAAGALAARYNMAFLNLGSSPLAMLQR
jgi:hypothetical protein